jgi:hypothetical protein
MSCPHCWLDEQQRYVYRCSRCGGCYVCQHGLNQAKTAWKCTDGALRPVGFDECVAIPQSRPLQAIGTVPESTRRLF